MTGHGKWSETITWAGPTITLEVLRALMERTNDLSPDTLVTVENADRQQGSATLKNIIVKVRKDVPA